MKTGMSVRCPKCNMVSNIKDVKSDFRLIQFMEAFKKQAEVLTQVQPKHDFGLTMCEFCEKHPILHHCVNCKQRICAECKIIHLRINTLKSHTIVSLEEDIKASLQEESHRLDNKKLEFKQLVENIDDTTRQVRTIETDYINTSKGLRKDCITSQEAERPQSNVNRFSALTMSEAGFDQKRGGSGGPMGRSRMGPPPAISGRRSDSRDKR